jgi:para-aminobenzoate synthetase component I
MTIAEFEETLNEWGQNEVPFLFIVDFEMRKPIAIPLQEAMPDKIMYDLNGFTNTPPGTKEKKKIALRRKPPSFKLYQEKFNTVYRHLERGDSYLANLTMRTEIEISVDLQDIFYSSKARYKLLLDSEFLVFSPEIFIQIKNGRIYSFPMKGTINASVPNAAELILADRKELAEHVTIVDLIRNDLSQVADNVKVVRFRYIDEILTDHNKLLQVSSEIVGDLNEELRQKPGTILARLLPAGSVTGAPKPKTLEIIRESESADRGYYTGVFGIFDGKTLDSGVMIRFIEKENNRYYYRSGGGITTQSVCELEYQEALEKIYVPLD